MIKFALVLFVIFLLVPLNSFGASNVEIPSWIKNNAKWWSVSQISDQDFAKGLKYLIQKEVIKIPQTMTTNLNSDEQIPSWLRQNAGWWSQGLLSDDEFLKGIQYLINNGMIRLLPNVISCIGNNLCISGLVEKIVDGDTLHIEGYTVRLSLSNTPERNETGYFDATEFTKKLCPIGSIASVDQDDKQPYDADDRLVGKVYCGEKSLNSELLYNEHAHILIKYCLKSEFSSESWAQQYGCATKNPKPQTSNCDPSYPDVCIPPYPPDLDCKDISFKNFRVLSPDPHKFDGDKNGMGCDSI